MKEEYDSKYRQRKYLQSKNTLNDDETSETDSESTKNEADSSERSDDGSSKSDKEENSPSER